ncbi:olfactory receptor 6K3-like [Bombina bombina]|uniref:olfactory receptor 6K3-like n=1 Tax=Bombina bombina TaxID=8345 RepID=UPI00235A6E57|nr:olfactory receptor 6K3-like [Bombina bombina]
MNNVSSTITSFLLLGLIELERFRFVYGTLSLVIYLFIILFSLMIALVVLTDKSLHEPMYILICNLVLNGMFGSTSFFPKLLFDLFSSSNTVSRTGCFIQALCVLTFGTFEISTITIMAYDRYLAVCHPLHYITLMTNTKVLMLIFGSLVFSFSSNLSFIILSAVLPLCGVVIKNILCGNMAIVNLSCVDTSLNVMYGAIIIGIFFAFTLSTIAYFYLRIFIICFTLSKESRQKAFHTLVTHLLGFSIFLVGAMFVFVRFRLNSTNSPMVVHILLSVTPLVVSPFFNPIIYGIRTTTLRMRMIHHLQKLNVWTSL